MNRQAKLSRGVLWLTLGWAMQALAAESDAIPEYESRVIEENHESQVQLVQEDITVFPVSFWTRLIWAGSTLIDPSGDSTPVHLFGYKKCDANDTGKSKNTDENCLDDKTIYRTLLEVENDRVRALVVEDSSQMAHMISFRNAPTTAGQDRDLASIWPSFHKDVSADAYIALSRPLKNKTPAVRYFAPKHPLITANSAAPAAVESDG